MSRLTPGQINQGHPDDPNIVLSFHPSAYEWAYVTPYFMHLMWVYAMVHNIAYLANLEPQRLHLLSPPDLARGGDTRRIEAAGGGKSFVEFYYDALDRLAHKKAIYEATVAGWPDHPALKSYDDALPPGHGWPRTHTVDVPGTFEAGALDNAASSLGTWTPLEFVAVDDSDIPADVTGQLSTPGLASLDISLWRPGFGSIDPGRLVITAYDRPGDHVARYFAHQLEGLGGAQRQDDRFAPDDDDPDDKVVA